MKSLHLSLGNSRHASTSSSLSPEKVIRALVTHKSIEPCELSFQKGDLLCVVGNSDNDSLWYEAHNPVTGARGLVLKDSFEEFLKNPPASIRASTSSVPVSSPVNPFKTPKIRVFYAVVLHDFIAERVNELDAKQSDPVLVVAHANREWLVVEPIRKPGSFGLIPASFVALHDPGFGTPMSLDHVEALMDSGDLLKVEDWKRHMMNRVQNSISSGTTHLSVPSDSDCLPLPQGVLLSAEVVSFHYEMDEYWFHINAVFQPFDPVDPHFLPSAKQLVLFRAYDNFYDLQVSLLEAFPREACQEASSRRILPLLSGSDKVDNEVTGLRRLELDRYMRELCSLNFVGASYVLEHKLIHDFLAPRPGDVENDIEPRYDEINTLFSLGEMKLSGERIDSSDYDHAPASQSDQTSLVKIKIFDSITDDFVVIRVSPKVTHAELMSKAQARLSTRISNLRYRNNLHKLVGFEGDQDLHAWLESAERHVLRVD